MEACRSRQVFSLIQKFNRIRGAQEIQSNKKDSRFPDPCNNESIENTKSISCEADKHLLSGGSEHETEQGRILEQYVH